MDTRRCEREPLLYPQVSVTSYDSNETFNGHFLDETFNGNPASRHHSNRDLVYTGCNNYCQDSITNDHPAAANSSMDNFGGERTNADRNNFSDGCDNGGKDSGVSSLGREESLTTMVNRAYLEEETTDHVNSSEFVGNCGGNFIGGLRQDEGLIASVDVNGYRRFGRTVDGGNGIERGKDAGGGGDDVGEGRRTRWRTNATIDGEASPTSADRFDDSRPRNQHGFTAAPGHTRGDCSSCHGNLRRGGTDRGGKWPWMLWLILKVLGLYWAKRVVRPRHCPRCYRRQLEEADTVGHGYPPGPNSQMISTAQRVNLAYLRTPEVGIDFDAEVTRLFPQTSNLEHAAISCRDGSEMIDDGYSLKDLDVDRVDESRKGRCRVCDTLWWTSDGEYRKYTDASIGIRSWNHRGSGVISLCLLIVYLALIIYDAAYYAGIYWGKRQDLLRYISYMSYLIFAGSVPSLCLYGLLQNTSQRATPRFTHWVRVFDMQYIVRRLQYLNLDNRGLPNRVFLTVCIVFPLMTTTYRFMFYCLMVKKITLHSNLAVITQAFGLTLYGMFSYFLYLLRTSLPHQLQLDVKFVRRHLSKLDVCRAKLSTSIQDFKALREMTNGLMVMIIGVLTWSVATQILENYLLYSQLGAKFTQSHQWRNQMYINGLVALESLMFFTLPAFAIGGLHINLIWLRFRYRLLELRRARHERFWYRLMQFVREQNPVQYSMKITMLFTMIGLFVALQFGDQHIFDDEGKNMTTIMPATPITNRPALPAMGGFFHGV